jgi:hypothetical protein
MRDRCRVLRYRNLVQRQAVQMKDCIYGLLMETGVSYNKLRVHRKGTSTNYRQRPTPISIATEIRFNGQCLPTLMRDRYAPNSCPTCF